MVRVTREGAPRLEGSCHHHGENPSGAAVPTPLRPSDRAIAGSVVSAGQPSVIGKEVHSSRRCCPRHQKKRAVK